MVEQGTHKPLVGSSTLPPGSLCMAWVYILRGSSGRHYIGSAVDLDARFRQHLRGHAAMTKRLGDTLEIVAKKEVPTLSESSRNRAFIKAKEKSKPRDLPSSAVEQPRKLSGLVGSSILPLAFSLSRRDE